MEVKVLCNAGMIKLSLSHLFIFIFLYIFILQHIFFANQLGGFVNEIFILFCFLFFYLFFFCTADFCSITYTVLMLKVVRMVSIGQKP